MRLTSAIFVALLLGVLQCSFVASQEVSGYILTSDASLSNKESSVYNDKNVKDLILHNLGVFDNEGQIASSSQSLISRLGAKDIMSFEKLNYVFLLEGSQSEALFNTGSKINHEAGKFNLCNEEDSQKCILNQLFSTDNKSSVLNKLKKATGNAKPEAFLFSNDEQVAGDFSDARLVSFAAENGAVYVMDQSSSQQFRIASGLESCVNAIFNNQYSVDLQEGVIRQNGVETPVVVFESGKEDFTEFMGDLCSVVGVSTLIRRDPNPSFFAFQISSLGRLEKFVSKEQSAILYELFNLAYSKFVKNLLAHYRSNEISGQVFVLSSKRNSQTALNFAQSTVKLLNLKKRVLEETTVKATETDATTKIIFRSILIVFLLVIVWVCSEMFNMDIQKDSVVYAKFLAADYFRR